MAQYTIVNAHSALTVRNGINDNFTELYQYPNNGIIAGSSLFYSGQTGLHIEPILTAGAGQENLEIINLGNWNPASSGTESRNNVPAGIYRMMGNVNMVRNLKWNNAQQRFEQYSTASDAYGSSTIEAGGEGANLNHVPAGTHHYQAPVGLLFSARGGGSRGAETDGVVTGYVNQCFAKLFLAFETTVSSLKYWSNAATDPMIWVQTKEAKGTENEMIALEANVSSATVYGAQYFRKSRGTMESKTVPSADDISGRLGWKIWDGDEYHVTAVIEGVVKGTVSNNTCGQNIRIRTSSTTVSGLTTMAEFAYDNKLAFFAQTPVARQVVPTGSTADQIITALQNLGLFSQT